MDYDFTLNGNRYDVAEHHGGWGWVNLTCREESARDFATPLEAQQDAINWEAGREQWEEDEEEAEREADELREEERKEQEYLQWTRR